MTAGERPPMLKMAFPALCAFLLPLLCLSDSRTVLNMRSKIWTEKKTQRSGFETSKKFLQASLEICEIAFKTKLSFRNASISSFRAWSFSQMVSKASSPPRWIQPHKISLQTLLPSLQTFPRQLLRAILCESETRVPWIYCFFSLCCKVAK